MRILSIDPATKSLAVSIVEFNSMWMEEIRGLGVAKRRLFGLEEDLVAKLEILQGWLGGIKHVIENMFVLKYANVFDLLPGQKLDKIPIEVRVKKLKGVVEYVKYVNKRLDPEQDLDAVLIEYQMSSNDKSRNIATALAYAFAPADPGFSFSGTFLDFKEGFGASSKSNPEVEIVGPALKSKVYFGDEGRIQNFRKKYMGNYASNKAHSRYNFLRWVDEHGCRGVIEGIQRANIDDVADSFMMAYAWAIKYSVRGTMRSS